MSGPLALMGKGVWEGSWVDIVQCIMMCAAFREVRLGGTFGFCIIPFNLDTLHTLYLTKASGHTRSSRVRTTYPIVRY